MLPHKLGIMRPLGLMTYPISLDAIPYYSQSSCADDFWYCGITNLLKRMTLLCDTADSYASASAYASTHAVLGSRIHRSPYHFGNQSDLTS